MKFIPPEKESNDTRVYRSKTDEAAKLQNDVSR